MRSAVRRRHRDFDGGVIAGSLPGRALRLVREWTSLHREDLNANWELAGDREPLADIEPLP